MQKKTTKNPSPEFPKFVISEKDVGERLDKFLQAKLKDYSRMDVQKLITEGHVVAACALLDKYEYDRIDYLADIRRCQCTKVPNPFYVDGAVAEEMKDTKT